MDEQLFYAVMNLGGGEVMHTTKSDHFSDGARTTCGLLMNTLWGIQKWRHPVFWLRGDAYHNCPKCVYPQEAPGREENRGAL